MFYGNTVQDTRQLFFSSWSKYQQKQDCSLLEQEIVKVILAHPEYHRFLDRPHLFQEYQYYPELGEVNPFLHMGLHLAIREQIGTHRPAGIERCYAQLISKYQDPLAAEHLMMEQLVECLWLSQKNNTVPDENQYLAALENLCNHEVTP
jgi:hypothetical protein